MFETKIIIAVIASVFAFIGNISYFTDVLKGKIKPHPYTWFVWSIVSMTTLVGGIVKGSGIGALPTAVAESFTVLIFLFSLTFVFKGDVGHIRKVDTYFLVIALLGFIPWILTKDPTMSVVIVVLIDIVAFIPTLRKTWIHPETEKPLLYEMNVARHLFTLFSLSSYNIATTIHSVAMIGVNALMAFIIKRQKK